MKTGKKLAVAGALTLIALSSSACSFSVNTEPDEASIVYSAAKGSATKFKKCVGPGSRDGVNGTDNSWTYPAGQRTFTFSDTAGAETTPMEVTSKDNVGMTVSGLVTFSLNTSDCPTFKLFHEKIGLKKHAYLYGTETGHDSDNPDSAGWRDTLNTYMKVPLDRALDAASQEFPWRGLYNDPKVKQAWEARVGQLAGQFVNETAGGQFFCSPVLKPGAPCGNVSVTIEKPQPPQTLVDALAATEAAKAENAAQTERNAKVRTELDSIKDLVKILGPKNFVLREAIKDGRAQVIVTDSAGVNVTPK